MAKYKVGDVLRSGSLLLKIYQTNDEDNTYSLESYDGRYKVQYSQPALDRYFELEQKTPTESNPVNECNHQNKKVVPMILSSFWYCPTCKSDLGNVI